VPDEPTLDLRPDRAAELLQSLMEVLYLSTACALGHHSMCRGVEPFRGLVCCCLDCEHTDVHSTGPTSAGVPLLHKVLAEEERLDSHSYLDGDDLGVRTDLVEALEKDLEEADPHTSPEKRRLLAVQLGVTACLIFAPRGL
jgi:hypothetical protein